MITSFGNKVTESIWQEVYVPDLPMGVQRTALRKLIIINRSASLVDLSIPPGNRLKRLKGQLNSFWSIRINDQWRIIFLWDGKNADQVAITDYH